MTFNCFIFWQVEKRVINPTSVCTLYLFATINHHRVEEAWRNRDGFEGKVGLQDADAEVLTEEEWIEKERSKPSSCF